MHTEFEMPVVKSKEQQAVDRRVAFPECAVMVDEIEAIFGKVTVLAMTEAGRSTKSKSYQVDSEFSAVIDGADYLRMGELSQQAFETANGKAKNVTRK
jgi:hypothetical protein